MEDGILCNRSCIGVFPSRREYYKVMGTEKSRTTSQKHPPRLSRTEEVNGAIATEDLSVWGLVGWADESRLMPCQSLGLRGCGAVFGKLGHRGNRVEGQFPLKCSWNGVGEMTQRAWHVWTLALLHRTAWSIPSTKNHQTPLSATLKHYRGWPTQNKQTNKECMWSVSKILACRGVDDARDVRFWLSFEIG